MNGDSQEEEIEHRQVLQPLTESSLILELPTCILADILARLSFKTVSICRCVCKTWLYLTASPDFDRLRFERSDVEVFLPRGFTYPGFRTLFWLDLEMILSASPPSGVGDEREVLVKKRVLLPKVTESVNEESRHVEVEYDIVNSCNGLMCLRKESNTDPCIVLNPITGEFITIPESEKKQSSTSKVVCGFGCSLRRNVYKIVRIFYSDSRQHDGIVEVYTLGTDSWRTVGNVRWNISGICPEFLNGAIHWLLCGTEVWGSILAFEFEDEQFRVLPPPSCWIETRDNELKLEDIGVEVVNRFLILWVVDAADVNIWFMKDYGFHESWTKAFSAGRIGGRYKPLKFCEDGYLLLQYDSMFLHFLNPFERYLRQLMMGDSRSFQAITLIPSFASLADVVGGGNLTVYDVKTRWTESEMLEDSERVMSLKEGVCVGF